MNNYANVKNCAIALERLPVLPNNQTLDIDGHACLSSFQTEVVREEIATIDPDLIETEASVPDGMH